MNRSCAIPAAFCLALAVVGVTRSAEPGSETFSIARGALRFAVEVQSPPPAQLAGRPLLLLNFSTDRKSSLHGGRYGEPARIFLEAGHRVASFDLPAHGERIDRHGSGIGGLCARVVAGEDPFAEFVADGQGVIDECIRRGLAMSGDIVVCGVSRAGYCAIRLAAGDMRVAAVAALAPVTDWARVREFEAAKDTPAVAALALGRFVESLVGRRVYVAIGNHDLRVGTDACTRFILTLGEAERRREITLSRVRYVMADDSPGHALAAKWRQEGAKFLLGASSGDAALPLP
jgi:hypothetical protein